MNLTKRIVVFTYALFSYVGFLAVFAYAAGFVGDFAVPKSIDSTPTLPVWQALVINLGVLVLFSVQHSVMARPAFKRWWTRFIPVPAERATYVFLSNIAMIAIFAFWQPMGGTVWHVQDPNARTLIHIVCAIGWLLVPGATLLLNHFDLFGLRQAWLYLLGRKYVPLSFGTPGLYRYVRHPLYVGWLMAFWITPTMTVAHLVFAVATTVYILIAIQFEERDLIAAHGQDYAQYRESVPMLVPRAPRKETTAARAV